MASLKQELKQILVRRQHRIYERELAAKNLTYDEWIRQQEMKMNWKFQKKRNFPGFLKF